MNETRKGRILIVDDDRNLAELLGEVLTRSEYEVLIAESADEAIAAVSATTPSIAVLDVRMPGTSGLELGTMLRDQFGVPFVFLTLLDDDATVRRATDLGALAYIVKPADMRQCVPTIDAAVARAAELKRLREAETHLSIALQQGREVSMAVGLLMERFKLRRDAAFERLRLEARSRRQRVSALAAELLESADQLNALAVGANTFRRHP